MYCQTCGNSVSESASKCSNCNGSVGGGDATSPYQPVVENHFTAAAALVSLFPLMGGLLPVAVDSTLVRLSGWAVLLICPIIGGASIFFSLTADKLRNNGQQGQAVAKAKQAAMISKGGLILGLVVTGFGVAVAFVNFLSGSGHAPPPAADQPAAVAPADPAPEAPAAVPAEEKKDKPAAFDSPTDKKDEEKKDK
jgi:hypothetical protein